MVTLRIQTLHISTLITQYIFAFTAYMC